VSPSRTFVLGRRNPAPVGVRLLAVVGALVIAGLVVWLLTVLLLWAYAWMRLGGIDLAALDDESGPTLGAAGASAPADATTVLVMLTEPRDPTRPVEPALAGPVAIVQVGGMREEAAALLIPTDLLVTVDGAGEQTLDEVHRAGGSELLAQTVIDYTQVRVDHVVSLSVDALPRLTEIVGPIELCLPDGCRAATADDVRAGQQDPDPVRVARVVAGAVRGVASALDGHSVARAPLAAKRAVDVIAEEFDTDVSLRGRAVREAVGVLARSVPLAVDIVPVLRHPVSGEIVPFEEPAMVRFQHLRDGTPFEAADPVADLDAYLAEVRIAVLNGAGVAGLAARVEAELIAEGLRSVGTGNAPDFTRTATLITYAGDDPRLELAAIRVAELLDGAEVERVERAQDLDGRPVDIVVTAGMDRVPAQERG
jgi:hypothetical protein